MEKYADYMRCGEIYKSPSASKSTPYILKCFRCDDVFLLLESFIFHIEDYCKQEEASTSAAVATIKSESADGVQEFSIELIEENYGGPEQAYKDVLCIDDEDDGNVVEVSSLI